MCTIRCFQAFGYYYLRNWDLDQRDLVAPGSSLCLLAVSFPCLWNYSRFAHGCKSGCLCTAGQAVPTHPQRWIIPVPRSQQIKGNFFLNYFFQVQSKKREKINSWPQKSQDFPSFPSLPAGSKQWGSLQNWASHGEIPVVLDIQGVWPCQKKVRCPGTALSVHVAPRAGLASSAKAARS